MDASPSQPTTTSCRDCGRPVSSEDLDCSHCGAPRPAKTDWKGEGYEWKSPATFLGQPLVHIAFGLDCRGKVRTARGIVAIGQRAIGVVAVGIISAGLFSFGVATVGMISLGVVSVALGCAVGVNAIGPIAFGVTAFGWVAGGLAAFGWKTSF